MVEYYIMIQIVILVKVLQTQYGTILHNNLHYQTVI
jgi:hypothetical protein